MIFQFAFAIARQLLAVALGIFFEQWRTVTPYSLKLLRLNVPYLIPYSLANIVLAPPLVLLASKAIVIAGGGLIALPRTGWMIVPGLVAYTLAMDFAEYAFHRAQHRLPFLWALHSFHHSDPTVNVSTTSRHFWGDQCIKIVTVYAIVLTVLRPGPAILIGYGVITYWNCFAHMNLRLGFGRWSWLINSPQYHRLHHSSRVEDQDRNFAALFPIYDVLFGTYTMPRSGDFAPTGLQDGDEPAGLVEAVMWPMRGVLRRFRPREA